MAAKTKTQTDADADADEGLSVLEKENIRLKTRNTALARERTKQQKEIDELEAILDRFSLIKPEGEQLKVPKWMRPKKTRKKTDKRVTPMLTLSDLHFDEVVDPYQMHGRNAYDRDIAHQRLERVINTTADMFSLHLKNFDVEGLIANLLGDIITGEIHDELTATNEAPVAETIRYWVQPLASAFTFLADEFGFVHVPCVDGNHDRQHKKLPHKRRAKASNAWIIYNWLSDLLIDDERITFAITEAAEQILPVYGMNFLLVHGDGFRYMGGVGGIYPPLKKYLYRAESKWAQSADIRVDHTIMGHWHQLNFGPEFTINGSLKGYDEYADDNNFGFERPQQALMLVTPENGITNSMPIFAD